MNGACCRLPACLPACLRVNHRRGAPACLPVAFLPSAFSVLSVAVLGGGTVLIGFLNRDGDYGSRSRFALDVSAVLLLTRNNAIGSRQTRCSTVLPVEFCVFVATRCISPWCWLLSFFASPSCSGVQIQTTRLVAKERYASCVRSCGHPHCFLHSWKEATHCVDRPLTQTILLLSVSLARSIRLPESRLSRALRCPYVSSERFL